MEGKKKNWLNSLSKIDNIFNANPVVDRQIKKIYLKCLLAVNKNFKEKNSSLDNKVKAFEKLTSKTILEHGKELQLPKTGYFGVNFEKHLYRHIYKRAEFLVRRKWEVRNNINPDYFSPIQELQTLFELYFDAILKKELDKLISSIDKIDDETEFLLNQLDNTRWKHQLKSVYKQYTESHDYSFICESIDRLIFHNKKNAYKYLIYYEASKVMLSHDRIYALKLYFLYLYENPNKHAIKGLNTSMQKKIAFSIEQAKEFDEIVGMLRADKISIVELNTLTDFLTSSH